MNAYATFSFLALGLLVGCGHSVETELQPSQALAQTQVSQPSSVSLAGTYAQSAVACTSGAVLKTHADFHSRHSFTLQVGEKTVSLRSQRKGSDCVRISELGIESITQDKISLKGQRVVCSGCTAKDPCREFENPDVVQELSYSFDGTQLKLRSKFNMNCKDSSAHQVDIFTKQ